MTPMMIPRRFQLQKINDDPDGQRRLREKRVLDDYGTERELLELRAGSHESQYQTIDNFMTQEINEKTSAQQVKTLLLTCWKEGCSRAETKSKKRWQENNVKFLEKYKSDFEKEYKDKKNNNFFPKR